MSEYMLSNNMHLIRPRECVHDALYLVGELKPNYPVPAIPIYVYRGFLWVSWRQRLKIGSWRSVRKVWYVN